MIVEVPSLLVSVGVTTAPRPANYLSRTLATLLPQTQGVHIFAEPDSELPDDEPGCYVHQSQYRLGNWHNWKQMCEWLLNHTATPFILTAEDDVIFSANAVADAVGFAAAQSRPLGFVSLYTSGRYSRLTAGKPPARFQPLRVPRLWGACAWLFPRESLQRILDHPLCRNWAGTTPGASQADGVDIAVGKILLNLQLPAYFATPSLAQHTGEHSAVGNNQGLTAGRTASDFVGSNN